MTKQWVRSSLSALIIYIASFNSSDSYSQASDSLIHYLDLAARNNPAVLQSFASYRAALEKAVQAGALEDPRLDMGIFLSPMEYVSGKQVADIRLMQMFPWFGVLRNARDEMSQMANARYEQFRDARLQAWYDLQKAWYDLYRIRKEIEISRKNLEILDVIGRLALANYRNIPTGSGSGSSSNIPPSSSGNIAPPAAGMPGMTGNQPVTSMPSGQQPSSMNGNMGTPGSGTGLTDIYRIQIETGDLKNSISLLESLEQTSAALFNSYLDRPAVYPVFTPDTLAADTLMLSFASDHDTITTNNPMLRMAEYERKSSEARKKMVTAMGYPMVGVGVNYSLMRMNNSGMAEAGMNGKDMIMPMVSLTLPIYRKKYNAMKREAALEAEAASYSYKSISNSLSAEYFQAAGMYRDAVRRLRLYNEQYMLASKSLGLMLAGFSVSSTDLTGVLRIRQQVLDYETGKLKAVADINTAAAWIRRILAVNGNEQK